MCERERERERGRGGREPLTIYRRQEKSGNLTLRVLIHTVYFCIELRLLCIVEAMSYTQ